MGLPLEIGSISIPCERRVSCQRRTQSRAITRITRLTPCNGAVPSANWFWLYDGNPAKGIAPNQQRFTAFLHNHIMLHVKEIHEIVLIFVCHRPRVGEYWNCRRPNPLGARECSVTSRGSKYLGGSAHWAANPGATRIFGCPSCGRTFEISVPLGPAARCYRGNHWRD